MRSFSCLNACSKLRMAAGLGLVWLSLTAIQPIQAQNEPPPSTPPENNPTKLGYHRGQKSGLPYELSLQITYIDQQLYKFHSPYEGTNSLHAYNENEMTDTYTLYMGARLTQGLEAYVNPEMAWGKGLSTGLGLAGFTNGDIVRNPSLGSAPYLARYFLRYNIATGHGEEKITPGENQIEGLRPTHRLVLTGGKLAANDIFDVNSYANSTRTQFMNWALINNAAYDYAADTRGYTMGIAAEWIQPDWAFRVGRFEMPTVANGILMHANLSRFHGDQAELELHPRLLPRKTPAIVRLLSYVNVAHMGDYAAALALARQTGTTPDITKTERNDAAKYGFGLNVEQALADDGATGVFGRYAWNDGATEDYVYTEADRSVSLGFQLSGAHWRRKNDLWALALAQNDLSSGHKDYLAAGGLGFLLGDGRLNYAPEQILETYYNFHIASPLTLSLDYQFIHNPGYNHDRGPVSVVSFRTHLEF